LNPKISTIIPATAKAIVKPGKLFSPKEPSADLFSSLPNELTLMLFKTFKSGSGTEPSITFASEYFPGDFGFSILIKDSEFMVEVKHFIKYFEFAPFPTDS
jgi:hypothetical protein